MNKTIIGIIVALIVVIGGGFAVYHNSTPKDAMINDDQTMKQASTSADAMMKDDASTMMASDTPAMMGDEKGGDAMMSQ